MLPSCVLLLSCERTAHVQAMPVHVENVTVLGAHDASYVYQQTPLGPTSFASFWNQNCDWAV